MKGFTLLEMLAALVVMSLLGAIAIPVYTSFAEKANMSRGIADLSNIQMTVQNFWSENMQYPASLGDMGLADMEDPWGKKYVYLRIEGVDFMLIKNDVRKDKNLKPINTDFDLYSVGVDGDTQKTLSAKVSKDDVIRAANGSFVGLAEDF
ncbi:MAG: prepilin-type N-terminal cleavage/methylation domain-containing protein [Proteobacteria bacterium]|nr:prepilin-type N-terminal cleavage/methylation domain-containing protein [Pseudomonadota bacterium]